MHLAQLERDESWGFPALLKYLCNTTKIINLNTARMQNIPYEKGRNNE